MIYLLQILNLIPVSELDNFYHMFVMDSEEIEELGYTGHEVELIELMLEGHYGIEVEDERQLNSIVNVMLQPVLFKSAINTMKLRRNK